MVDDYEIAEKVDKTITFHPEHVEAEISEKDSGEDNVSMNDLPGSQQQAAVEITF